MTNPANLKKSILDYAIRGELSAKFRLSCHCEKRTGGAISSISSLRESEANEAIQKNSKISKFKDNDNSLDCFDFSAKNLAMTNKTAFDEIAEFNAKISTLKSQREKLLSNLEKLLKTKPNSRHSERSEESHNLNLDSSPTAQNDSKDKIAQLKRIISKLKTKINSYKTITPLNTDGDFNPPFEIPNSWAWVKLEDVCEYIIAGGDKPNEFSKFKTDKYQIPIYTNAITDKGLYGYTDKATIKSKETITISGRGTIGFPIVRKENYVPIIRLIVVCPILNLINTEFLKNVILFFEPKSEGTSIPQLTVPSLKKQILIPLPPKAEQIYISQVLQNLLKECESYEAKALNLANLQSKFKSQIPKSILDYAVRGELSAKFRLSCHCEKRTGGAIQKNSKISKFKDNGNSLDCFDFSAKNLAMTNKTALDEIAEFNAKISTLKSQREKLLSNLEKLLKTKPNSRHSERSEESHSLNLDFSPTAQNDSKDKIAQLKRIISKLKTKINSYKTIMPLNTDGDFNPPFEIPNSWAWVKLGEICEIYTGDSINENIKQKEYFGQKFGLNYIGTKDVNFDNSINYENGVKIPQNSLFKFKIAKENSVLMCIEGGSAGRKIAILNQNVCFGNKLCCFFSKFIENKTIFYYLQSAEFFKTFSSNLNGIIGGVNIKKLNEILNPIATKKRARIYSVGVRKTSKLMQEFIIRFLPLREFAVMSRVGILAHRKFGNRMVGKMPTLR